MADVYTSMRVLGKEQIFRSRRNQPPLKFSNYRAYAQSPEQNRRQRPSPSTSFVLLAIGGQNTIGFLAPETSVRKNKSLSGSKAGPRPEGRKESPPASHHFLCLLTNRKWALSFKTRKISCV